ncbi:YraN family protein [Vibrio sp. 10N.261.51.F12]|uniref:YraN family protein n=1 Tax=Vibrio sp. 10N.261.51.F12 TaxID=3229679 RepID=UPI0035516E22
MRLPWQKAPANKPPATPVDKRKIGQHYEDLAQTYLGQQGLNTLTKNYTVKCGELDLIMKDATCLVFVEVKYRQSRQYGSAQEMVTPSKAKKLQKAAMVWLMSNGLSPYDTEFRFDVVAIHNNGDDIEWIKNAITQG